MVGAHSSGCCSWETLLAGRRHFLSAVLLVRSACRQSWANVQSAHLAPNMDKIKGKQRTRKKWKKSKEEQESGRRCFYPQGKVCVVGVVMVVTTNQGSALSSLCFN